jgi:hypothetical protein
MRARVALPFLVAALLLAAPGSGRAAGPKDGGEKQRIAALPEDDRKWLDFVAPIVLPEEKKAFLELAQTWEREKFKGEFWKRRERDNQAPPFGPGYKQRYQELRELAETKYDRWPNDAAAMVLHFGEPSSINTLDACSDMGPAGYFRGLEIWTYSHASPIRGGDKYLFYRRSTGEPRRMWVNGTPDSDVFTPESCIKSFQELALSQCTTRPSQSMKSCPVCPDACEVARAWNDITTRQGSRAGRQHRAGAPDAAAAAGRLARRPRRHQDDVGERRGPESEADPGRRARLRARASRRPRRARRWRRRSLAERSRAGRLRSPPRRPKTTRRG